MKTQSCRSTKRPVSEAQRLANQRNAQKSTGPRTPEGKARSRQNSSKHNLTGRGVVLLDNAPPELQAKLDDYTAALKPQDPVQADLVRTAVVAAWRVACCQTQDFTAYRQRQRRAEDDFDARQHQQLLELTQRLADEPGPVVAALTRRADGCAWMIEAWTNLQEFLDIQGFWDIPQYERALHLLGRDPQAHPLDASVRIVRHAFAVLHPDSPHEDDPYVPLYIAYQRQKSGEAVAEADQAPPTIDAPRARQGLEGVIAGELAWLEGRRAELEPSAAAARSEAPALAQVDTSAEAQRLLRYESASHRQWHQSLNQLRHLQRDAAKRAADPLDDAEGACEYEQEQEQEYEPEPAAAEVPAPNEPICDASHADEMACDDADPGSCPSDHEEDAPEPEHVEPESESDEPEPCPASPTWPDHPAADEAVQAPERQNEAIHVGSAGTTMRSDRHNPTTDSVWRPIS